MKKTSVLLALLTVFAVSGCKQEKETPKVIYEDEAQKKKPKKDKVESDFAIADLPLQIQGTKYLIHPVGNYRVYEGNSKMSYGSSNADKGSFVVSNYNRFELTGFLQNIKFQHIDSSSVKPLTSNPVLIETMTFLNTIADKSKLQLLVYTLADQDTNKDGEVNSNDIKTLYISKIDGSSLMKLSADFQEVIDWNLIESKNRLYFRTIEDTNKNGQFDKDDFIHYNFVDLLNKEWTVMNYDPI
ncbi:MAG: hypothetical protein ACI7YS_09955 [Flavobacterium sp.]